MRAFIVAVVFWLSACTPAKKHTYADYYKVCLAGRPDTGDAFYECTNKTTALCMRQDCYL